MKVSAMDNKFLQHTDAALVFDDYPSMQNAIYDENIDATEDTILILRNAGSRSGPGMPEWGILPAPTTLVKKVRAIYSECLTQVCPY